MTRDPKRLYDGQLSTEGGMDSGSAPNAIGVNQVAWAVNVTMRNGFPSTRPPYVGLELSLTGIQDLWNNGLFQGACMYQSEQPDAAGFLIMKGGHLFRLRFTSLGNVV